MAAPTETVALLFTDIEGSTRLWERSPEAMRLALRRHDAILGEAIAVCGERLVGGVGKVEPGARTSVRIRTPDFSPAQPNERRSKTRN